MAQWYNFMYDPRGEWLFLWVSSSPPTKNPPCQTYLANTHTYSTGTTKHNRGRRGEMHSNMHEHHRKIQNHVFSSQAINIDVGYT